MTSTTWRSGCWDVMVRACTYSILYVTCANHFLGIAGAPGRPNAPEEEDNDDEDGNPYLRRFANNNRAGAAGTFRD